MKSFGVGCLNLSLGSYDKGTLTVQSYIDEVKRTLEKITTVTDIEVRFDEDCKDEEIDTSIDAIHMNEGGSCNPCIGFFELEFKIYIPLRVQANITKRDEKYINTRTDNFKVYIKHDWHGPVAFVECLGADSKCQPSTAVRIVRQYLEKEIKNSDSFLIADYLGPSPFHADFYLSKDDTLESDGFSFLHTKKPGYDHLSFNYRSSDFDTEEDALVELFDELSQELAFFYSLKTTSRERMRDWVEIAETMDQILEFEGDESKVSFLSQFFKRPKLFRKVFQDIGLFKGRQIMVDNITNQHYSGIYISEKHKTYLQELVDKEISNEQVYPVNEASELMTYFDQKTAKSFELTVIFIAAVLGGIVGALITVLFGGAP